MSCKSHGVDERKEMTKPNMNVPLLIFPVDRIPQRMFEPNAGIIADPNLILALCDVWLVK
jgi:hypothetical protein